MDSSLNRLKESQQKADDIRRKIALLQAQLVDAQGSINHTLEQPTSPKRKRPHFTVLAPSTPSPKKRKLEHNSKPGLNLKHPSSRTVLQNLNVPPHKQKEGLTRSTIDKLKPHVDPSKLAPSGLINKLAALSKRPPKEDAPINLPRSSAFTERAKPPPPSEPSIPRSIETECNAPKRDDRLALIEDLEIGPYNHVAPFDDPGFEQLEPNSGIRLTSRIIPHDDIEEYLCGRYYLSPSRLYSVIRLLPNKQAYDVPVDGDWVTIAVVAERGPVKFSRAPIAVEPEDNGVERKPNGAVTKDKRTGKSNAKDQSTPSGKKYVNVKLIDFGARSRSSSSATGGKAVIRGDAFLTLLLFESDGFDLLTRDDGGKAEKVYRGGSRGAFESMSKLKEGDVIALLNPRILKPFQRSSDTPHPTNNILALTPESASSIIVIGRARDLGMCTVVKRDGKVCGGWCDKRTSDVCDWHLQNAVQMRRAGRPEFSIGTSGMSSTSAPHKRKPAYDPTRQWGLKPAEPENGKTTYVVSGHVVNGPGSASDPNSLYIGETIGREGQAKARRKLTSKDADLALKTLLERDKEGMQAVVKAREVAIKNDVKEDKAARSGKPPNGGKNAKAKRQEGDEDIAAKVIEPVLPKKSYSAEVIKHLGFDPAAKTGHQRPNELAVQKKLDALVTVHASRKDIVLGPRPGPRIRSGVIAPLRFSPVEVQPDIEQEQVTSTLNTMIDLDDL